MHHVPGKQIGNRNFRIENARLLHENDENISFEVMSIASYTLFPSVRQSADATQIFEANQSSSHFPRREALLSECVPHLCKYVVIGRSHVWGLSALSPRCDYSPDMTRVSHDALFQFRFEMHHPIPRDAVPITLPFSLDQSERRNAATHNCCKRAGLRYRLKI
ncbi:hypothetical protein CEXT_353951 [Caerostris extrusa]|uniref:HNH nuclease domain-containing protein n=1 Tax=Caerostris extrusa TaxID=172846 RepID=A0AAV4NK83_CAEEX|nr:hypothetical protein CEXT_353951 [Caerostris extrusa]